MVFTVLKFPKNSADHDPTLSCASLSQVFTLLPGTTRFLNFAKGANIIFKQT